MSIRVFSVRGVGPVSIRPEAKDAEGTGGFLFEIEDVEHGTFSFVKAESVALAKDHVRGRYPGARFVPRKGGTRAVGRKRVSRDRRGRFVAR